MAISTMRAVVCRKLGFPTLPMSDTSPIYVEENHPKPKLSSPTFVLVKVATSTVNFATGLQVEGKYQEKATPPYVTAEELIVDASLLYKVSNGCDLLQVTSLPVVFESSSILNRNWVTLLSHFTFISTPGVDRCGYFATFISTPGLDRCGYSALVVDINQPSLTVHPTS